MASTLTGSLTSGLSNTLCNSLSNSLSSSLSASLPAAPPIIGLLLACIVALVLARTRACLACSCWLLGCCGICTDLADEAKFREWQRLAYEEQEALPKDFNVANTQPPPILPGAADTRSA